MQSVTVTRRCLDLYRFDIQTEANTTIDTTITNRSYYLEIMMDDFL